MTLAEFLRSLDTIHRRTPQSPLRQRDVFNVLPAYVRFHAVFGYILLAVGLAAIILRIPIKQVRKGRWIHPYVGFIWLFGTTWMGITAIWCVQSFVGWDVIAFFIFSMYGAIQIGWIFIKAYRYKIHEWKAVEIGLLQNPERNKAPIKVRVWKWLHASAMIYSFCMLLGAGISFPFRAVDEYSKSVHP